MIRHKKKYSILHFAFAAILLFAVHLAGYGQIGKQSRVSTSDEADKLYHQAILLWKQGLAEQSLSIAQQALNQSIIQDDQDTEVGALELIGDITYAQEDASGSLAYYLRAAG